MNGKHTARLVLAALALVIVLALPVRELLRREEISFPQEKPYVPAEVVYITPSGECYHREDCSAIARSEEREAVAPGEAAERGLTACKICVP